MSFLKWFAKADVPTVVEEEPKVKCSYCGGTKFFEGPSGGMSTNILCANPDCRHWFNYHGGILPMDDLHRIEPSAEEKAGQADAAQLEPTRRPLKLTSCAASSWRWRTR